MCNKGSIKAKRVQIPMQNGHRMGLAELLGNMPKLGLLLCTQLSEATSFVEQSENSLKPPVPNNFP